MPAIRKITDEEIRYASYVVEKRREALRQAEQFPTLEALAADLGVTPRYLREVLHGRARAKPAKESIDELIAQLDTT